MRGLWIVDLKLTKDCAPNFCWQELGEKPRTEFVNIVTNRFRCGGLHMETFEQLEALEIKNVDQFARVRGLTLQDEDDHAQTELGLFAINWNYPDCAIKQAFADFLSEGRQENEGRGQTQIRYKLKARGRFLDRLNWLGALRLVVHYQGRTGRLANYGDGRVTVSSWPYAYKHDLYKNAKRARNLIKLISATLQ
jgi:hypothetical protein